MPLESFTSVKTYSESLVDHYDICEVLGEGGFAVVLAARRLSNGVRYAVKVLPAYDGKTRAKSMGELLTWSACCPHPNIIELLAVYENTLDGAEAPLKDINRHLASKSPKKGKPFPNGKYLIAVMPTMSGGDLFDCSMCVTFTPQQLASIAGQLAAAFAHMHAEGFAHGDMKPENVLLEAPVTAGSPIMLRISDFGFARAAAGPKPARPQFTRGYISPEGLRSQTEAITYGAPADMWAVGVTMFVVWAKRFPFQTNEGLLAGDFPAHMLAGLAPWMQMAIRKLLLVDEAHRYTAGQLQAAVAAAAAGEWEGGEMLVPFAIEA
jgi:serine/threonine protein kinase